MTDIKDHKTFWKRSTMEIITYTEGTLADIIQLARNDINSLITTIESQNSQIESLKAITELAVKTMTEIATEHFGSANSYSWQQLTKSTLYEIERIQNEK